MFSARRLSYAFGSLIFLVLMGLVVSGYQSFQRNAEALQMAGQEDISWTTSQLELELMRFRQELQSLRGTGAEQGSSNAQLNNRFDIMWSRVDLFQRGRVGERLQTYDADSQVVARLFATMQAFETQIVTLRPGDNAAIDAIDGAFRPFSDEMREFSRRVILGEQEVSAEIRALLRSEAVRTFQILAAAIAMLLLALANLYRESALNRRLADHNRRLAEEAERASRTKSAFLTMMSHELRTPMNGVLGLLALGRQSAVGVLLNKTLEQAERSAKRMIALLADILDFSAIQSGTLAILKTPFSPHEFVQNLRESCSIGDASPELSVDPDMPEQVVGDQVRLVQVFLHLGTYLLETAGVRDVSARFSYQGGHLLGTIAYSYEDGDTWYPEMLVGEPRETGDNFATGAVGPTIAREMISQMDGTITVHPDEGEGGQVIVSIPAAAICKPKTRVRLMCQSAMVTKLCEVALRGKRIIRVDCEEDSAPDVVIFEWLLPKDDEILASLRHDYPAARIICLGGCANESLFDQCLSLPLDINALRDAIKFGVDHGESKQNDDNQVYSSL